MILKDCGSNSNVVSQNTLNFDKKSSLKREKQFLKDLSCKIIFVLMRFNGPPQTYDKNASRKNPKLFTYF